MLLLRVHDVRIARRQDRRVGANRSLPSPRLSFFFSPTPHSFSSPALLFGEARPYILSGFGGELAPHRFAHSLLHMVV